MRASAASSVLITDGASKGSSSPPRDEATGPIRPVAYRLTGPSVRLDPRIHAVRRDIADVALADRVFAPHYAEPAVESCRVPTVPLRAVPDNGAVAVSELLLGERFAVVDVAGDWAWGYGCHDHYVGYVPTEALGPEVGPTHVISAPAALVFAEADIKSPVRARLPMGARLVATGAGDFSAIEIGYIHNRHLSAIGGPAPDPVEVAQRLIGTPYRWGGRSGDGIDCSGLVQLAHAFAGRQLPRDSDQQRAEGVDVAWGEPLQRGDLLFLPSHVGMIVDGERLLHANAYWMQVAEEPLADVLARHADVHPTVRRLS